MVTLAKAGAVPAELEAMEEGEHVLTIEEVTIDLENKFKDEVRPVIKIKWKTADDATFLSSMGLSLWEGKGNNPPAKLRDTVDKLGIRITESEEDGTLTFDEKALVGRKVKAFVEKSASGWPKVTKVLRAADGATGAAAAAVANGLGAE